MSGPSIVLVTPALAAANNGNWQTARRWQRLLAQPPCSARVSVLPAWRPGQGPDSPELMIALHARRSADSVLAWRDAHGPRRPLALVLTGTDLYRDIQADAQAQTALRCADRLVVLNRMGCGELPPTLRDRCRVVLQSASARRPVTAKTRRHLRAVVVGHLRDEKDPRTVFDAMEHLADRPDIRLDHIGHALDPIWAEAARALQARCPCYRWLGGLPHGQVRRRIQQAHVLVHTSRMEGGAHVVIEALRSGTPVVASHIPGNLGLLGEDYPATFAVGDALGLATWLRRLRDDPDMLTALAARAATLSDAHAPEAETGALHDLIDELMPDRVAAPGHGGPR